MFTKYVPQNISDYLAYQNLPVSLYTEDGVLLLAEGTRIDEGIRHLIQDLKQSKFQVFSRIDLDDKLLKFDKVVELDKELKARTAQTMFYLFNDSESKLETNIEGATELASTLTEIILSSNSLSVNLEALKCSDEYTYKHSLDVATISTLIGRELGLHSRELKELATAGLLHDIGKRNISKEILNKNGSLTDAEFMVMKQHSTFTYDLLKPSIQVTEPVKQGCLQHHEKWNGNGYPNHLEGYNINYYARIMAVADVFDALVTDRPYHKHYTPSDAIEMMSSMVGHFDIDIYKLFLRTIVLYPVGSLIKLSNNTYATVLENHKENILRPTVKLVDTGKVLNLLDDLSTFNLTIISESKDTDAANPMDDKMAIARKETA